MSLNGQSAAESWTHAFRELRDEYIRGSADRLQRIEDLLKLLASSPKDHEALSRLRREFHGLAGSGSTYGFSRVTTIGLQGETECDHCAMESRMPESADLLRWQEYLEGLRIEFQTIVPEVSPVRVVESTNVASTQFEILVVDDDPAISLLLAQLLRKEGMKVRMTSDKHSAIEALQTNLPDGVITDVFLPDGTGYELVEYLRNLPNGESPAVLIVSTGSQFPDRVEAIRCGADGFFEKPLDWESFLRRLHYLLERNRIEQPRILSVEDDSDQAAYLRTVLEAAGYQVRICSEPANFETDLISFHPDLILMDILLPGMTGYELVRFMRHQDQYATLPVLFLSTEGQVKARMKAVQAGGDDYLLKPISPALLLSTVASRLERSRFLRSLMERDGLTGLLTHTVFQDRARAIFSQRKRKQDKETAFVMLDVDHFKSVNDRFGHMIGDRVLASLAALLRRRLRRSDLIGRYGGEEFALVVDDLRQEDALQLVSKILAEFQKIEHRASDGTLFRAAFSAGIAMLQPQTPDFESWKLAADKALYEAKVAGRSRIHVAPEI